MSAASCLAAGGGTAPAALAPAAAAAAAWLGVEGPSTHRASPSPAHHAAPSAHPTCQQPCLPSSDGPPLPCVQTRMGFICSGQWRATVLQLRLSCAKHTWSCCVSPAEAAALGRPTRALAPACTPSVTHLNGVSTQAERPQAMLERLAIAAGHDDKPRTSGGRGEGRAVRRMGPVPCRRALLGVIDTVETEQKHTHQAAADNFDNARHALDLFALG